MAEKLEINEMKKQTNASDTDASRAINSSVVANLELRERLEVLFPHPSPHSTLPFCYSPLPSPRPSLPSFLPSLPLEVGPLNPAKGSAEVL